MSRIQYVNNEIVFKAKKKSGFKHAGKMFGANMYTSEDVKAGQLVFINSNGDFSVNADLSKNLCIGRIVNMEPDGEAIIAMDNPSQIIKARVDTDK